jgi:hypothetical protein
MWEIALWTYNGTLKIYDVKVSYGTYGSVFHHCCLHSHQNHHKGMFVEYNDDCHIDIHLYRASETYVNENVIKMPN